MLFDLTFPCYLTTFLVSKREVYLCFFCPAYRSSPVPAIPYTPIISTSYPPLYKIGRPSELYIRYRRTSMSGTTFGGEKCPALYKILQNPPLYRIFSDTCRSSSFLPKKKEEKVHHCSHIRLIRRPIYKTVWNSLCLTLDRAVE
jgi:hypothetical protein